MNSRESQEEPPKPGWISHASSLSLAFDHAWIGRFRYSNSPARFASRITATVFAEYADWLATGIIGKMESTTNSSVIRKPKLARTFIHSGPRREDCFPASTGMANSAR